MTTLIILLTVGLMSASATSSLAQRVSLNKTDANLEHVIEELRKQSGYDFLIGKGVLEQAGPVSIRAEDMPLKSVLERLARSQHFTYTVLDAEKIIVMRPVRAPATARESLEAPAQQLLRGRVTDESGTPLDGVTVSLLGGRALSSTDDDGRFQIDLPGDGQVLEFSAIGYLTQTVSVGASSELNVVMKAGVEDLEEIVVVGYGRQSRSSLTASVSTLKGGDIAQAPVANPANALGGRATGIVFKQNSGEPGSDGADIRIRGVGTTGNSSPLLVVDGVYRDYQSLDPNTIESMTVLKDAAAVAPYGLAGANGVILVTTKRGTSGRPTVAYNGYYGWQNPTKLLETVNSYEYAQLRNIAYLNENPGEADNLPYSAEELEGYRKTVDGASDADPDRYPNSRVLRDLIQRNAAMTSHAVQVSGGADRIRYFAGFGYLKQEGMWTNKYMDRYNAMVNLDIDVTATTKLLVSANTSFLKVNSPGSLLDQANNFIYRANSIPPTTAIYFSNGLWGASGNGFNPVGEIYTSGSRSEEATTLYSSVSLEQQLPFVEGLSLKGTISYDPVKNYTTFWSEAPYYYTIDYSTTPYSFNKVDPGVKPSFTSSYDQDRALTFQGYINYRRTIGPHDLTGLAVAEARQSDFASLFAARKNYSIPIHTLDMGSSAQEDLGNGGTASEMRQVGFVYRLGYGYAGKYLVEASGRYDGHYYFAPGSRWAYFPAFSVGWRLSEEPFMRDISWLDNLKLRGSWGESGNLAGEAFQYLASYGAYSESYRLGGSLGQGLFERAPANTAITWERQRQTDIGFEATLWKGKLSAEFDYFFQERNNMLLTPDVTVPVEYGIGLAQVNAGIMHNRGVELSVSSMHRFANGLTLDIAANVTYAKNKMVQIFENQATFNDPNRRRTGRPFGAQFGYVAVGLFQSQEEIDNSPEQQLGSYTLGDIKYADLNGDNIVDGLDQTLIGGAENMPETVFGFNPRIAWKGFDVNVLFQGATGMYLRLNGVSAFAFDNAGTAVRDALDNWSPDNRDARYPRITSNVTDNNRVASTWWMRDATYIRLKTLNLGYTLPSSWITGARMQAARVYLSGQNLLTWASDLKQMDPETVALANSYLPQRVFTLGLNLNF